MEARSADHPPPRKARSSPASKRLLKINLVGYSMLPKSCNILILLVPVAGFEPATY